MSRSRRRSASTPPNASATSSSLSSNQVIIRPNPQEEKKSVCKFYTLEGVLAIITNHNIKILTSTTLTEKTSASIHVLPCVNYFLKLLQYKCGTLSAFSCLLSDGCPCFHVFYQKEFKHPCNSYFVINYSSSLKLCVFF